MSTGAELTKEELKDIAYGSALLGGGNLKASLALVECIPQDKPVTLIDYKKVEADEWGAVITALGSTENPQQVQPESSSELFCNLSPSLCETFELLRKVLREEKKLDCFSYTLGLEIGANLLSAMLISSSCEIPLVDGDGAGRGVPELGMTTYASRISVCPTVLSNVKPEPAREEIVVCPVCPETSTLTKRSAKTRTLMNRFAQCSILVDKLVRGLVCTDEFTTGPAHIAIVATYGMSGKTLQTTIQDQPPIIPGTIRLAQQLGSTIRQAQGKDPVKAVLDFFNDPSRCKDKQCAFNLFQGKVDKIERKYKGGFGFAMATISNGDGQVVRVLAKIESLIAWYNDRSKPIAMGPDIICYLREDGNPVSIRELELGNKVTVLGVKANERLRKAPILDSFLKSLNELGYFGKYVPIEKLQSQRSDDDDDDDDDDD